MARVAFIVLPEKAADCRGLVHGGLVFCLAAYAENAGGHPSHVMLAGEEVYFLRPVGERLMAEASRTHRGHGWRKSRGARRGAAKRSSKHSQNWRDTLSSAPVHSQPFSAKRVCLFEARRLSIGN